MYFSRLVKKKANEFELRHVVEYTDWSARRIRRCPGIEKESSEDSRQLKEPGELSRKKKETDETFQLKESSTDNIKVGKLEESLLIRFGPLYSVDQPSVAKEKAWQHILDNSSEMDPSVTMEVYLAAIRRVEQEAEAIYAENTSGVGSDFCWMMIKDGCFFLQLALSILGISPEQLGYTLNDPIFGKKHNKKDVKKWIEAMFFVGNQIPLVVLNQLMQQKFFQEVIDRGEWDPPPSGFCKRVLYEVLVLPARQRSLPEHGLSLKERFMGRDRWRGQQPCDLLHALEILVMGRDLWRGQQPSDMLHALQNLVMGPGRPGHLSSEYDEIDLEANEEDDVDDYERILPNAIGIPGATDNRKRVFPSATELKRAGILIKKLKTWGVRSIHVKVYYLFAHLHLPILLVDDHTEIIFRSLKTYENTQQLGKERREISSYFRVMRDIIRTTEDVKILHKERIVQGNSADVVKLPGILSRLSSEDIRLTDAFRSLRHQIRDYSSPWVHYRGIVRLVVILILLQTVFALLAYFRPPTSI